MIKKPPEMFPRNISSLLNVLSLLPSLEYQTDFVNILAMLGIAGQWTVWTVATKLINKLKCFYNMFKCQFERKNYKRFFSKAAFGRLAKPSSPGYQPEWKSKGVGEEGRKRRKKDKPVIKATLYEGQGFIFLVASCGCTMTLQNFL